MIDLITPINALKDSLQKVQINEQNKPTYERLTSLISILENRVKGLGGIVCNSTYLSNITSYLSNIQSYVNTDISNPDNGYYVNIPGQIDNIISQLMYIPSSNNNETKQSLSQIVGLYKRQNDSIIQKMTEEKNDLAKQLNSLALKVTALETQIANKETELTTLSNNLKSQFADEQIQRDKEFTSQKNKISEVWLGISTDYKEKIEKVSADYEKIFTEQHDINQDNFDELHTNIKTQSDTILDYIKARKEEIKKIYGLVGDMVSCGEYKKYALEEHESAEKLFLTSFVLMCISSLVMIIAIIVEMCKEGAFSWWSLLTRLPIAFILLLPALYTAIEARRHRNQEIELRDFEIKIANIDPYLKNIDFVETVRETAGLSIPEGTKTARDLKIELAKEFFSKKEFKADTDNIVIPKDMIELVEKFMSFCDKKGK